MKRNVLLIICCMGISSIYAQKIHQATLIQRLNNEVIETIWDTLSNRYFTQLEPQKDHPSDEPTRFIAVYDSVNLYFFIHAIQKNHPVTAKIKTRDLFSKNDDVIGILLDTYNDRRSGFFFMVNPLGTQVDVRFGDDGRTQDLTWDAEWSAESEILENGWRTIITIPFTSLKYKKNLHEWGFNIGRVISAAHETSWWSGSMNMDFRISQGGLLTGLETPGRKRNFIFYPYSTVKLYNDASDSKIDNSSVDVGADLRMEVLTNLQANVTINPDFATVEADREQINLTRYELNYPEKRLFFQEGNELFNTRIRNFYSRRVGDIDYGGKVAGKVSDFTINALSTKSSKNSDIDTLGALFSSIRVKKDIFKSSTVGVTYADKSWQDGYARSLSLDYVLNLGNAWKLTGQYVGSAPGDFLESSAWFVRFARESNIYHYHIRYTNLGEHFQDNVNQTGFIVDDDRHELDSDISYRWWLARSNILKYLDVLTKNNIFWSHAGTLRSWYVTESIRLYLKNKFSADLMYNNEYKLFEKDYYNYKYGITLGYNTDEWSSVSLDYQTGRNFDRNLDLFTWTAKVKLSEKLSLDYTGNSIHFEPDTANYSTFLNVLSANYYFTKDLWVRLFAQNNSSQERFYVYGMAAWRFKPPFGAVYFIYSRDDLAYMLEHERRSEDVFYFKVTYPIGF